MGGPQVDHMSPSTALTPEIEAERSEIKERLKMENDLIHQRMTWLGAFSSLLLAAISFAYDKAGSELLLIMICVAGTFTSVSLGYAIYRANVSIDKATARWDAIKSPDFAGLDVEGFRSGSGYAWLMPGRFIPKVLILTWTGIFISVLLKFQ
jgi:hypothetical protein